MRMALLAVAMGVVSSSGGIAADLPACIYLLDDEPESIAVEVSGEADYQNVILFKKRASGNGHFIDIQRVRSHGSEKEYLGDSASISLDVHPPQPLDPRALPAPGQPGLVKAVSTTSVRANETIVLSSRGANRYFWYQPKGSSKPVAARVLDLHIARERGRARGVVLLVESIVGVDQSGARIRSIAEVQADELHTIRRDSVLGSEEAEMEFASCLTPMQTATRKLAESLRMRLFGYSDRRRGTDSEDIWKDVSAMTEIESGFRISAYSHGVIERRFGSYEFLLTGQEDYQKYNPYPAFARLNPAYVLDRFGASNLRYGWVIVEDGQLIVMPMMDFGANLFPQLMPLAMGRKIYSGGVFSIQGDGAIRIEYNSHGYQSVEGGDFRGGETMDKFVRAVFDIQTGRRVDNLDTHIPQGWARAPTEDELIEQFKKSMSGEESRFRSQDDPAAQGGRAQGEPSRRSKINLSWDPEKELPLDFENWKKREGLADRDGSPDSKFRWAHYVLGSSTRTKFEDIKRSYRKLSKRFHSDRTRGKANDEVQKVLNLAWEVIREQMR